MWRHRTRTSSTSPRWLRRWRLLLSNLNEYIRAVDRTVMYVHLICLRPQLCDRVLENFHPTMAPTPPSTPPLSRREEGAQTEHRQFRRLPPSQYRRLRERQSLAEFMGQTSGPLPDGLLNRMSRTSRTRTPLTADPAGDVPPSSTPSAGLDGYSHSSVPSSAQQAPFTLSRTTPTTPTSIPSSVQNPSRAALRAERRQRRLIEENLSYPWFLLEQDYLDRDSHSTISSQELAYRTGEDYVEPELEDYLNEQ